MLELVEQHPGPWPTAHARPHAYPMVEHPTAYADQDVALKAGVPGHAFAKSVLVNLDGEMAMAVI